MIYIQPLSQAVLRRTLASLTNPAAPGRREAAASDLLSRWMRRSAGRHRLATLGDHLLADIGLTREAAETEVTKPFWRA